jgi:hypothetical protein
MLPKLFATPSHCLRLLFTPSLICLRIIQSPTTNFIIPFFTVTNPEMPTFTTDTNCIHPSLPPIQSPTTDPSPPGMVDEEVVVLDVVSPATTTENPCMPPVNVSTHAAAGKNTEVSNRLLQSSSKHSTEAKVQHAPWILQGHCKRI